MPWPEGHKSRTRKKIVEAASAAFRDRGISGVRVEDVMARAGLTHGGFYAHFQSKDELLLAALEHASEQTVERLSKPLDDVAPQSRWTAVIDTYLSSVHVAHPEMGCPLASLGPELARARGATQRALATAVKRRLAWMRQLLPEEERDTVSDESVIGTVACMLGGMILARAVGEREGLKVLGACRDFLRQQQGTRSDRRRRRPTRRGKTGVAARAQR